MNLALRIIGLLAAIAALSFAGLSPLIVLILAFVAMFSVHYTADLIGDDLFQDESTGVAITRHAGFAAAIVFAIVGGFGLLPKWALVVGFISSLATHLVGDVLSLKEKLMAFDLNKSLVLYPFLGWMGLKIADIAASFVHGNVTKVFVMVGLALAETGLIAAYRIYRDGNDPAAFQPDPAPKV